MNRYLVGLQVGGIMEDPKLRIEDKEIIEANTAKEAEDLYNKKHNCSYYYGCVIASWVRGRLKIDDPEYVTHADTQMLMKLS